MMYYIGLLIFIFISISSCHKEEFKEQYSDKIRKELKDDLVKLDPINFKLIMGRIPKEDELELGRMLFNDPVLSRNNDVSCATCHLADHGFADGNSLSVGSGGVGGLDEGKIPTHFDPTDKVESERTLGSFGHSYFSHRHMFRNSLSTVNVAHRGNRSKDMGLFWDGRFGNLSFQVLLPMHTAEELCGTNPIVKNSKGENPFAKGGPFFKKPIKLNHVNSYDAFSGQNTGSFNASSITVDGIPLRRKNAQRSVPNRNECLALTLSKINSIPYYKREFKRVFNVDYIDDKTLAKPLASFILTHESRRSPYDEFLSGKNSLSKNELLGLVSFFTTYGQTRMIGDTKVMGAGCISCHDGPTFGGNQFASLGVKSDFRSALSKARFKTNKESGFFDRPRGQRGLIPNCIIDKVSVSDSNYAPDIGLAGRTLKNEDCFKQRVPTLRNVVETYPYYHHGSEKAEGEKFTNKLELSLKALTNVVKYHLRGRINVKRYNASHPLKPYVDEFNQIDVFIPISRQEFFRGKNRTKKIKFTEQEIENIVQFIALGLWDKNSVKIGALGNDVSHPSTVPSGLTPPVIRDQGTQLDFIPKN